MSEKKPGILSLIYQKSMAVLDKLVPVKLQPFWHHPAGPKTVFFWGPAAKSGLVLAGVGDLTRPADELSIAQSASLAVTTVIWSRWSLVIIPKNYFNFMVNFFICGTQMYQLFRALSYQHSLTINEPKSTKD